MNQNEALAFLNPSQGNQLGTPAQPESMSPDEKGIQLAPQQKATGMSQEDALAFLGVNQQQQKAPIPDSAYLNAPIPEPELPSSDPNNLTSNYTQSVPQATPQRSQGISKEDALAFLGASPSEQTGKTINLESLPPEQQSKPSQLTSALSGTFEGTMGLLGGLGAGAITEAIGVPTTGPIGLVAGVPAFFAGMKAGQLGAKEIEKKFGFEPEVQASQQAYPKTAFIGQNVPQLPLAAESALGYGTKYLAEGLGPALGQAATQAGIGAVAGEPIRYGVDVAAQKLGATEEKPQPITPGSVAETAAYFAGLGGKYEPKAPELAPSANPVVNQREAAINAAADAQAPIPEAPKPVETAPVSTAAPAKDLTSLLTEQLFHEEGSPEHTAIQKQIDALNKPAEAPVPVSDLNQKLQDLTNEQNRLVIEELPKYPEGSIGRRQIQNRIDQIRLQQADLNKQRELVISEETKPAEAPVAEAPTPKAGETISAIHFSKEPMNLSKDYMGSEYADNVYGSGFYAMQPSHENIWQSMDFLKLGANRNEVNITPKNPLIITPDNVGEFVNKWKQETGETRPHMFDSWLKDQLNKNNNDAIVIHGFFDKYPTDVLSKVDDEVRKIWNPEFPEGKTSGRFLNGDELENAQNKVSKKLYGIPYDDLVMETKMQDQIYVPAKHSDIIEKKPAEEPAQPTQPNAPKTRKVEEGNQPEHPNGDETRQTAETGGGNRPVKGGEKPQEEVTPITENTRNTNRDYRGYPKGTQVEIVSRSKDPLSRDVTIRFPDGKTDSLPEAWLKKPKTSATKPKETLPNLVKTRGRDAVNDLLNEWNEAELSPDGKYILGIVDPRSTMKPERIPVREFLDWLQEKESTKIESPVSEKKVEPTQPAEVVLTEEQQAEKVLLDKIDAEAGKPKAPKPKAPKTNPYTEVLRRYESGEEDSISTPQELVSELFKVARKQRNQALKDAIDRFHEAMDVGADIDPEVEKLINEVNREADAYGKPKPKKGPKEKARPFGAGDDIIEYLQANKLQSKFYWQKALRRRGETPGEGEYGSVPTLPKRHSDSLYGKYGEGQTPNDAILGLHMDGKALDIQTPDQLWDYIKSQSDTTLRAEKEEAQQDSELKKLEDAQKEIEAAKDNPDKLAEIEAQVLRDHFEYLRRRNRGEGAYTELPRIIYDAAIKVGDSIRKGATSFKDWSNKMISRLGEGVRDFLKDIWAGVRDNWNKDIGGGSDTGGRSREQAQREAEAKYGPKAPTDRESFAKKAADALLKGRGTPITEEEMQNILSRKFPGITSREASDLYASATGTPKPPAPYAGIAAEPSGEKISLKNENADAETKALGLPELTQQDEQEMNAAMDRAKATSAEDPMAGQRLAESLIADPRRSLTGDESALLLKHKTDLFNSLNKMAEGLTEGSPEQRFEKGLAYDNASKAYHDLLQAIKDRGSEWGREGRWRQALLHQDYTFATQERLATAAKRKPLTSNEKTKLAEETKRLTEIDKEIAETQEKEANKQEQKKAEQEIKNAPQVDPYIQSIVDRVRKNVSSAADAARERIRQRRAEGRLFTGVDPTDIADYAIIGADHLLEGTTRFADWSSKMIGEFGEKIRPYLDDIFKKSKEFNEKQIDKESKGSKSVNKRVSKAASPEERIRKGQETRARNRLEQLKQEEERQKKGDFSKPVKKAPIEPSEETKRLRIEAQKIKDRIDKRRADFEKANRPAVNKVLDAISALNRFNILSHVTVLEHLAGAAVENIVTRPVSSTLSQLFRFNKTLDAIRRKAVYEGGLSAKSELKGVFGIATSAKDIWNKLLKGKTDIDWLYGGKNNYAPSFVRAVENIHGAMKEPVRQGIFSRSLQLRIDAAEKMGLDPTNDEVLYQILASEAVNDANMDIFMGDNFITRGIRGLMRGFEANKQSPRLGKFVSALMDIAMPVMNVPTNIAIRKMRLAGGLIGEFPTRLAIAAKEGKLANGAEALTTQEAEQIMRAFKYGTLGIAIGAYAWTHSNQFGGIINNVGPNAPENKDLKKGEMELGGIKIARPLGHGPVATYMNMVADARRMYDKSVRNNPNSKWSSLSEPAFFSMFVSGLGSMPPAQAATRFFSPFTTAGQKVGQTLRDMLIPGAVQDVAAKMDTKSQPKDFIDMIEAEPIKRSPKTLEQEIMKGIPGLRQKLPMSKPRGSHAGSSSSNILGGSVGGRRKSGDIL